MRKHWIRILKILIAMFVLFMILFVNYIMSAGSEREHARIPKTTFSTRDEGIKALYLLTKEMGYSTGQNFLSSRFWEHHGVMVVYEPDLLDFNTAEEVQHLLNWLNNGGQMVLLPGSIPLSSMALLNEIKTLPYKKDEYENVPISVFSFGSGRLFIAETENKLLNANIEMYQAAYAFISILETLAQNTVIFNEYYHGIQKPSPDIFELIGIAGRLILLQLFIALIAFIASKYKTFGQPDTVFSVIKRKESENVYALANLYMTSAHQEAVLNNCFIHFISRLRSFLGCDSSADHDMLITLSEKNRELKKYPIKQIINGCERFIAEKKNRRKLMISLVKDMEKVERAL